MRLSEAQPQPQPYRLCCQVLHRREHHVSVVKREISVLRQGKGEPGHGLITKGKGVLTRGDITEARLGGGFGIGIDPACSSPDLKRHSLPQGEAEPRVDEDGHQQEFGRDIGIHFAVKTSQALIKFERVGHLWKPHYPKRSFRERERCGM